MSINNQCYLTGCCYREMISCSQVCLSQFSEVLEGYTEKKNLNILVKTKKYTILSAILVLL